MNQSTSVSVSFGSHVHHTPHTGLAHIAPVTMAMVQKTNPTSADA